MAIVGAYCEISVTHQWASLRSIINGLAIFIIFQGKTTTTNALKKWLFLVLIVKFLLSVGIIALYHYRYPALINRTTLYVV
jgi:hypothetical protein